MNELVFVDTNVLLYAVDEAHEGKHKKRVSGVNGCGKRAKEE